MARSIGLGYEVASDPKSIPTLSVTDATVTAVQSPALSLGKSATPGTYDHVGAVISYSYLVKNTGNVTLAGPVTVSDDKTTVTCPPLNTVGDLDDFLDPGEAVTCTSTYTITGGDVAAAHVTNTASASAQGVASNSDSRNGVHVGAWVIVRSMS